MKTPEEMAKEYRFGEFPDTNSDTFLAAVSAYKAFLAGYQAAKDDYKVAIDTYNDVAKQMMEEAVRIMSPKDQLQPQPFHAGADVYIIDANNPLPKPMPLSLAEQDQLADAGKVMDICEHILDMEKMVDVNSSEKPDGWISVKERLPEEGLEVLIFGKILNDTSKILGVRARFQGDQKWKYTWESEDIHIYTQDDVTHWMPLPEAPKGEG